jgi:chorismate--pyruvate lyase
MRRERVRPACGRVARWLAAQGSLSVHLRRAQPPLAVRVLAQGRQAAGPALAPGLQVGPGQAVHARTVLLTGGAQAMVLAHSAVVQAASRGAWRAIRGLAQRPLAELLFTRSDVRRSPLVFQRLPAASPLCRQVVRQWTAAQGEPPPGRTLWQRASVFTRQHQRLVVIEYFVPALVAGWPALARQSAGRYSRSE